MLLLVLNESMRNYSQTRGRSAATRKTLAQRSTVKRKPKTRPGSRLRFARLLSTVFRAAWILSLARLASLGSDSESRF
jgi:hypothetical protein